MSQLEVLYDPALRQSLLERADALAPAYSAADPFPHAVLENFLPAAVLEQALARFPHPSDANWLRYKADQELKLAFADLGQLPDYLRNLLYFLNGPVVLEFLERLTGIQGLLPDPYLLGGGLHQIQRGGFLKIHADFNKVPRFNLLRRINLLIYLNQDWPESYGGHLELWNSDMTQRSARILPVFNRCVIFNTTSDSYHGNPEPLTCPEDRSRKSIALYYYVADVDETKGQAPHSTLWQEPRSAQPESGGARTLLKRLTPPIVIDAWRGLKR